MHKRGLRSAGSFPKWPIWLGLGQVKAGSLELPFGWQGPGTWTFICCLPRHIDRELDWNKIAETWTDTYVGCHHSRWWLNPLCHNGSPMIIVSLQSAKTHLGLYLKKKSQNCFPGPGAGAQQPSRPCVTPASLMGTVSTPGGFSDPALW